MPGRILTGKRLKDRRLTLHPSYPCCRCPFRHLGVPSLFPSVRSSVLCSFHPSGSGSSRWSLFQFPPASPAPTGCTERRAENRWDREENRGLQTLPWLVERRSASRCNPKSIGNLMAYPSYSLSCSRKAVIQEKTGAQGLIVRPLASS